MSGFGNQPRAMFGGLLEGNRQMRFIFVDEAGTSAVEPVTVVAGIIVNADRQLIAAEAAIEELHRAVPPEFRDGFVSHATEIWGVDKYRDLWRFTDRIYFLKRMMSLPRKLKLPISMSIHWKGRMNEIHADSSIGLTLAEYCHYVSFQDCLCRADKWIRDHCDADEIGTVIAEDVPEMRQHLKRAAKIGREWDFVSRPEDIQLTPAEIKQGYCTQESEQRISRIRNTIHFVQKQDDPLVQIADACAFGLRRFFAQQSFGDDFCEAIVGEKLDLQDWSGPSSHSTFFGQGWN